MCWCVLCRSKLAFSWEFLVAVAAMMGGQEDSAAPSRKKDKSTCGTGGLDDLTMLARVASDDEVEESPGSATPELSDTSALGGFTSPRLCCTSALNSSCDHCML